MPPERPFLGMGYANSATRNSRRRPRSTRSTALTIRRRSRYGLVTFCVTLRTVQSFNAGDRPMKSTKLKLVRSTDMRPVAPAGRKTSDAYRVREHLTEAEMTSS